MHKKDHVSSETRSERQPFVFHILLLWGNEEDILI